MTAQINIPSIAKGRRTHRFAPLIWGAAAVALALAGIAAVAYSPNSTREDAQPAYGNPAARRDSHVDRYHGTAVPDPYRWMENRADAGLATWLDAQEALLQRHVGPSPVLARAETRIARIRSFDSLGLPVRGGDHYFFTDTKAGASHPVLSRRNGIDGKDFRLLDFADAVASPAHRVGGIIPSPNGSHVAWAHLSPAGFGWLEFVRADNGDRLAERLDGISGASAVWDRRGKGLFYLSYGKSEALEEGTTQPEVQLRYHLLGDSPADDTLLFAQPETPNLLLGLKLSDDGRYLVLSRYEGTRTRNKVSYLDLEYGIEANPNWVELISQSDAVFTFEANVGRRFLFQTTLDAPRGRVIAIDLDRPDRSHWQTLIPQRADTLATVSHIGGRLVVTSTLDARPNVEIFRLDGARETAVALPQLGLISGLNDDPRSKVALYQLNSLTDPGTVYRLDLEDGTSTVTRRPTLAFDPDDFVLSQRFYTSADGTRVPIFLAHHRNLDRNQRHPVFMYGYGHGGWTAFPWFQPHLLAWLEMGGIYALPGVRGGGEYGASWQEAGTRRAKQNTIDDFIAAAEWLVAEGYTTARTLVANGGSASGVLAAAALVQRPELFGAALIEYPFLDMFRYHHFTAVKGWTGGYGTVKDAEDFAVLARYSPLHNLERDVCYPPTLTIVAGEDTLTAPMHGYKLTATLQHNAACPQPYLLKHLPAVGHYSYGTDPIAQTRNQAEILAFLIEAIGWRPGPLASTQTK